MEDQKYDDHQLKRSAEEDDPVDEEVQQRLLPTLERATYWDGNTILKYKGCWYRPEWLKPIQRIERHFKPRNTDVIISSIPKSGTTWLKSLAYSIANRSVHHPPNIDNQETNHPLFTWNPHDLVQTLEVSLYMLQENPNLDTIPSPRIFATHLSYDALPSTVHESHCKIIYICRNPMDRLVSERHFIFEIGRAKRDAQQALFDDDSLDHFGRGIALFGPSWEHILSYWEAHKKNPDRVMFLKYEDLKRDENENIIKIAEFMGFPFSAEEVERDLMVEKISKLCSFGNLSEANREGITGILRVKKSSFFRKGEVGDWSNYLSKEMAQRMKDVMKRKLQGSGLTIEFPGL